MSNIAAEVERLRAKAAELNNNLLLSSVNPNKQLVEAALSFDASSIGVLDSVSLSSYILVLAQYLLFLQMHENQIEMLRTSCSRILEFEVTTRKLSSDKEKKVTEKDRRFLIIATDETLAELDSYIRELEAEKTLLSNLGSAIVELLNAFKKEKSSRDAELKHGSH